VRPRAVLDAVVKRKIPRPRRKSAIKTRDLYKCVEAYIKTFGRFCECSMEYIQRRNLIGVNITNTKNYISKYSYSLHLLIMDERTQKCF